MLRNTRITSAIILCLLFYSTFVFADTLQERIDSIIAEPCLNRGIQGVVARSLKTGEVLYQHDPDTLMIPASNLKLLTSAAALDLLGPDFRYTTDIYTTADPDSKGVVNGDLLIVGSGDPVLSTSDIAGLARALHEKGVSKVTGSIVVDDTLFDNQRIGWGWGWDDLPYYYAAPVGALNLNRNVVEVYVYPGKSVGAKAIVQTVPATDYIRIESSAITGNVDSEKTTWVYRNLGSDAISVGGSIPIEQKVESYEELITVENPALYAGHIMKTQLARQGIRVLGGVRVGEPPKQAKVIVSHTSPPLSQIITLMNKQSDNMIAETLLRTLGAAKDGKGSTEAGIAQVLQFCGKAGIDKGSVSMADGSGLARRNFISAHAMIKLLAYMQSHKYGQVFIGSLPVAGVDGTLKSRMKGSPAENMVRAKTGFVSNVSTLSGYVTTGAGDTLVFAILLNNHLCTNDEAKAVQDRICEALVSQ